MTTRRELTEAVGKRYRAASDLEKTKIRDEFTALTGYHRKHAVRVLNRQSASLEQRRTRARRYDEAVQQALILLWEAGDRVCGKRLKALIPLLLESIERHGHLCLDADIKAKLEAVSAATIDRMLGKTRAEIDGKRRRRVGVGSAIRRSIPVRTFDGWNDPSPGFFEVDMDEYCGGVKQGGDFVHTLVLTDIATGWTECVAMPVRDQSLIVEGFARAASDFPFKMLGVDTDNDSAFMSQTVFDYCKKHGLQQTRSRAYKKNDQAWVEQKNGAIVRRLVGYGRLSGLNATSALAQLYAASRLYINFFQPSFKLKSKARDGARVQKKYHSPMTPCDRLLARSDVSETTKVSLRQQFNRLDPVLLLREIRNAQHRLADFDNKGSADAGSIADDDIAVFLRSLSNAWKDGEVRPTHRRSPAAPRHWRTRLDPFEHVWPLVLQWLESEPAITAKEMMARLAVHMPDAYAGTSQLRTLQRRVKQWRAEQAKNLILGALKHFAHDESVADVSTPNADSRMKDAELSV